MCGKDLKSNLDKLYTVEKRSSTTLNYQKKISINIYT